MKAKLYIYKFKTTPGSRSHYSHFTDEEIDTEMLVYQNC